jgi:catechol 2,3-dioxygenase-like lactoylglutathione lyase family enzyme
MRLNYAIKFVSDMDAAVAFYRDALGLKLHFQSPFWSEFETGETKLALHPASDDNPPGKCPDRPWHRGHRQFLRCRPGAGSRLHQSADGRARHPHRSI